MAISNIAWDEESRRFYEEKAPEGLRFYDFDTLFGEAASKGEVVISNFDPDDPRRKGTPKGHPAVETFLAVPLVHEGERVGVVGVANRETGYGEDLVEELEPVWSTVAQLVDAYRTKGRLADQRRRIRSTLEGTGSGTWSHDATKGVVSYDAKAQELLGCGPAMTLDEWSQRIHPDDRAAAKRSLVRALAAGESRLDTGYRIQRDGAPRHVMVNCYFEYADGALASSYGLVRDVTEQRRAEHLLALSQRRYERLVEGLNEDFVVYSRDVETGQLVYTSEGIRTVFGISPAQALSQDLGTLVDWCPGEANRILEVADRLLAGEIDSGSAKYRFVHPEGDERVISIHNHLAIDERGRRVFEGLIEDITERTAMEEQLRDAATHDALTRLLNRTEILQRLHYELERADRYERPLAVLMLDIDHFKRVNDRYGHQAGDLVLRSFGDVLRKTTRSSDHTGRYGGEEFLIVAPEISAEQAERMAARLREAVAGDTVEAAGETISVTTSIGIAHGHSPGTRLKDILARADGALYRAKAAGRNCVRVD